ncbi:MAG: C2 domain-containing protein [Myxococcales bacterium]|nr:C2 domain-containing protein [Myxococcales bacterium]
MVLSALAWSVGAAGGCTGLLAIDGEFSAEACGNETVDEDGDGLVGCQDPDCYHHSFCADAGLVLSAMDAGSGGTPAVVDAGPGTSVAPPAAMDDGGDDPVDAAMADAAPPVADATITDAQSTPPVVALRILRATVPDKNVLGMCNDTKCGDISSQSYVTGPCPCSPDVFIVVSRLVDGSEVMLARTETAARSLTPSFAEQVFPLDLQVGDLLNFGVWDDDQASGVLELYDCNATVDSLEGGPISCSTTPGATIPGLTYRVDAELLPLQ